MIINYFNQHSGAEETPWLNGDSSFITGARYNRRTNTLSVKIKGEDYRYEIDLSLADRFTRSGSWGRFYNQYIKDKAREVGIARKVQAFIPTSAAGLLGFAQLAIIALPLPLQLPTKIGIGLALAFAETGLDKAGVEKSPEIEFAINIAKGFSMVALLRYPATMLSIVGKSPYGSIKYLNLERRIVASMTKGQALKSLLLGGKLIETGQKQYVISQIGRKIVRTKAPIVTNIAETAAQKASRQAFDIELGKVQEVFMRGQRVKAVRSKYLEAAAIVATSALGTKGLTAKYTFKKKKKTKERKK